MTILMVALALAAAGLFFRWCEHGRNRRLPPGSMGWPYIGETLKLYTENPNSFFSTRRKRYGKIFKSHILGCPCVMISSPEAAKMVLASKAHLFKPTYPQSKERLIGPAALFFHQGHYHSLLKRLVAASFSPSAIRGSVASVQTIALKLLSSWEHATSPICTLLQMKKYAFEVAMMSVLGGEAEVETEGIRCLYGELEKGYNSMAVDIPGSRFYKAMKVRKALNERLMKIIERRRGKGGGGGLLGNMLRVEAGELTDSQIADNIIGVIFAAHDTTATVLTWLLKYLHDNPNLLQAVAAEQEGIARKLQLEGERGLTWDDTRDMSLTARVIQETLRSASIVSFTFREAVEDVELEGYVIPKGWKVLPLFRSIHHTSDFFPRPHKFDPSRFEVSPRPYTYMPFGNGLHSCPGSEFAKLEMLVLLHHLITTYRWRVVGEEDAIQYGPFPVPKGGLPIHVTHQSRRWEKDSTSFSSISQ
ncbi:hypothetical protein SASPL_122906 [Salvia splendens]|uniref:(+)-abscisic acid 8'-hydroxylase n=1 Tax=Salvia splendens TaxID=180675 RepID=A0A8X8XKE8_SALSN|nr:abscisic acid 8'-hydroxylase 2-like isoform X2 [Salvia splendens]KAG6415495.1 hypothetical protein SASPL_122906 [Salvia splendens]